MNTMKLCPKCRQPLAPEALLGLCPECMMKAGLETEAQSAPTPTSAAPAFTVEEVARLFPQLEIIELLGQGGMGVVFKARQPQLDRLVALKIMLPEFANDPAFAERFTREARALAKLNHPNIVTVYDFGRAPRDRASGSSPAQASSTESVPVDCFFFIMEFIDGANLRQMLHGGHLSPEQALAIVPKICDALQFAHEEGIMHRDIKPENIIVDKKGRVKIADFGLAKILGQPAAGESITVTGMGMGTPKYMAPEQIENAKTVDHRADIYSLGVVFYEMLTGELPLGRFAPPSQKVPVDVRLDDVVLKSLEKEPDRRYQHASEVKQDVENMTGKPGPQVTAVVAPQFARELSTAPKLLVASGIVTILSAVFTGLLLAGVFVDRYSFDAFFRQDSVQITLLVLQALALSAGILMLRGGLSATHGQPAWSRTGAVLGLIPCTPGWLITMPLCIFVLREISVRSIAAAVPKRQR